MPGAPPTEGRTSAGPRFRFSAGAGRHLPVVVLAIAFAALCAGLVFAACGDDVSGGGAAGDDRFAGAWAPVDARLEIGWSDTETWYGISLAGAGESYGGLLVDKDGDDYTATLVGLGGTRTDAFPATATGDALTFEMPVMDTPTTMTLTLTGEGTADMSLGESGSPWAFARVDELIEETPAP